MNILLFEGNYIAGLRVIFYNQSEMKCDTLRSLPSQNKMPNAVFTQSTCRGVSHTPEYANLSTWLFLGRMRYAPT
ncbi:hypothetical protein [Bacteroides sp. An269]|uniref:hypothetical protein n=1 Tax=Bacteroides sp. An269 TaxID=1965613 RepID=UPI001177B7A4|nr:hypothetical protein [Bacteroides sp. An269]